MILAVLYVIAVVMGISLGLIGAGGAIVAVPAFVYLGGIDPSLASGYALFVAAVSTFIGSLHYLREKMIDWRSVGAFGASTLITIALVRRFILPSLPETFSLFGSTIALDTVHMVAFSAILVTAGVAMLRHRQPPSDHPVQIGKLFASGFAIGIISGFLGVGGGFLMTPALVLWARLDMKRAVGTSLVLIAANGLTGVLADLAGDVSYDWPFLLVFTGCTSVGIIAGSLLSKRIDGQRLKRGFGYVVLTLGIAIALYESVR